MFGDPSEGPDEMNQIFEEKIGFSPNQEIENDDK